MVIQILQLCRPSVSALGSQNVDRQCRSTCRSLVSADNVSPCTHVDRVAGLTEFSYSVYRPTVTYGVYGVAIGNCFIMGINANYKLVFP